MLSNQKNEQDNLLIRAAKEGDITSLLALIKELAVFEKLSDQFMADEATLKENLFGERPYAEVYLAFWQHQIAGYALYFHNFSTFLGRPGLYIEDIYVREHLRGKGIGKALLLQCVKIARARNCQRVEWLVLNWNPARQFYEKLGAYPLKEWQVYRLDRQAMDQLS